MDLSVVFVPLVLLIALAEGREPGFCTRGFQIAGKYHACWQKAGHAHPYTGFQNIVMLTPDLVEDYAAHMCRVVKPLAMDCLGEELAACEDKDNLLKEADKSGGACLGDDLNPFFKLNVLDHLKPIRLDSKCFAIGDSSYNCYTEGGQKVLSSGDDLVDINQFSSVANKFFNYIWNCHIDVFKNHSKECPNWQIPMLLALQKTAMPSLYGMHLTNHQVALLELSDDTAVTASPLTKEEETLTTLQRCEDEEVDTYMLIRIIKDPAQAKAGDLVLKLSAKEDQRDMSMLRGPYFNAESYQLVQDVLDINGDLDLAKLRKKIQEQRRNKKEIADYLDRIRNGKTKKKGRKNRNRKNPRKPRGQA